MNRQRFLSERGQSLVLVVVGFIAFVAILALVIDGGNAYVAKRQAQNAADAGALAGAQYMCQNRDKDMNAVLFETINIANTYAASNGAINPSIVVPSWTEATVEVNATVIRPTFFAGLIGFDNVEPSAVAKAACRPPGVAVLPVAWSCRVNVEGSLECSPDLGPCRNDTDPTGLKCTYILMDSVKVKKKGKPCNPDSEDCYTQSDLTCSPPHPEAGCAFIPPDPPDPNVTIIDCDLDDDCTDELMSGGARSWLDLNGSGGGANELKDWIDGSVTPDPIEVHTWLPEESGVATSIFQTTANHLLGKNVVLPVFNKVCNGLPTEFTDPETQSQCNAWDNPEENMDLITNSTLNFHIISFSAFHVTCVQTGKNRVWAEDGYFLSPSDKDCYGHARAVEVGSIDDNDKTIEGYFVRLNLHGYGGPGDFVDTGTFTVVLIK